jgi:hypothetical protein
MDTTGVLGKSLDKDEKSLTIYDSNMDECDNSEAGEMLKEEDQCF